MLEYTLKVNALELQYLRTAIDSDLAYMEAEGIGGTDAFDPDIALEERRHGEAILAKIDRLEQAEVFPN